MGGEGRKNCNGGADERAELVCQSQIGLLVVVAQQEQPGRNSKEGRKEGACRERGREREGDQLQRPGICQTTNQHTAEPTPSVDFSSPLPHARY